MRLGRWWRTFFAFLNPGQSAVSEESELRRFRFKRNLGTFWKVCKSMIIFNEYWVMTNLCMHGVDNVLMPESTGSDWKLWFRRWMLFWIPLHCRGTTRARMTRCWRHTGSSDRWEIRIVRWLLHTGSTDRWEIRTVRWLSPTGRNCQWWVRIQKDWATVTVGIHAKSEHSH